MAKLLFVIQQALGWRTYGQQIRNVLEARSDVDWHFLALRFPWPGSLVLKRTNLAGLQKLVRRRDPLVAMAGSLGRPLRRAIQRISPDAIHFGGHWPAAAVAWREDCPPFTVAVDATRASAMRDLRRGRWGTADMAREADLLRRAARIYPVSAWAARSVAEDCAVDPARVRVMPWSVDVSRFVPPSAEQSPRLPRVLFIGADFSRKGGPRLLKWMQGPLRGLCELHVVSGDAPADSRQPGVVFHGRVANDRLARDVLPFMDMLCLPTLSDMSAWVVIEASAAGLPSVASDVGGIRELIRDGETGRIVRADDDAGFIAALSALIGNPALRQAWGSRARAEVMRFADARANYGSLIDTLKKIAADQRGSRWSGRSPGEAPRIHVGQSAPAG